MSKPSSNFSRSYARQCVRSLLLILLLLPAGCSAPQAVVSYFQSMGEVHELLEIESREISEMSGLAKSKLYEDVYWVHNDSGDRARLFAVDGGGQIIEPYDSAGHGTGLPVESATNVDWEDIATDGGRLFVADMGNNANTRRDLGVYILPEADPREASRITPGAFIPLAYPDQEEFPPENPHYDSEALFVSDGQLYFLTKHRNKTGGEEAGTKLYRLDSMKLDSVNQLTLVGDHPEVSFATAADVSPSGRWLAVLTYTRLWLFPKPEQGDNWLSGSPIEMPLSILRTGQAEAITWISDQRILIGNEGGKWFSIDLKLG